ncbi:hypothetical protein HBI67_167390 [Parastagonospora nodorum]|nr:hypothetical protein HBI67_167390 [Parastagonospora nodorum]
MRVAYCERWPVISPSRGSRLRGGILEDATPTWEPTMRHLHHPSTALQPAMNRHPDNRLGSHRCDLDGMP